ncbi:MULTISPECIES: type II secretion system protein [unclassified Shewanella]|uniref:type II secretion system protein n=1 Tax=unclassified Shewanella TaxID=196818 RepID=UPI0022BA2520|nr:MULTISPECIES: type II secretion system protein [unclassified Shewanella]
MKTAKGFTLIELVVVIIILGILAVTAAPKFISLSDDANLSVVQGTRGALKDAVTHSHLFWQIHGNGAEAADLPDLHDGSFNFNSTGYPVESGDRLSSGHGVITSPNANMCGRLWNGLLDHSPELDRSGEGNKTGSGNTVFYYSVEGGVFKVNNPVAGTCIYALMGDDAIQIQYDSNTGNVTLIQ